MNICARWMMWTHREVNKFPFSPNCNLLLFLRITPVNSYNICSINSVMDEVIRDASFNAKVLALIQEDVQFIVEENDGKGMIYLGTETTNLSHYVSSPSCHQKLFLHPEFKELYNNKLVSSTPVPQSFLTHRSLVRNRVYWFCSPTKDDHVTVRWIWCVFVTIRSVSDVFGVIWWGENVRWRN